MPPNPWSPAPPRSGRAAFTRHRCRLQGSPPGTGSRPPGAGAATGRLGATVYRSASRGRRPRSASGRPTRCRVGLMWASDCPFVGCEREVGYRQT